MADRDEKIFPALPQKRQRAREATDGLDDQFVHVFEDVKNAQLVPCLRPQLSQDGRVEVGAIADHDLGPQAPAFQVAQEASHVLLVVGPNQGEAGKVPACSVRGPQVLNICQLYEKGPVVLALFVDGGSCPEVLSDMQHLAASYPQVGFAAVAIKGGTSGVRKLIHERGLTFPVGLDRDGALAALYKVASCPQLTFARRGGIAVRVVMPYDDLQFAGLRVHEQGLV